MGKGVAEQNLGGNLLYPLLPLLFLPSSPRPLFSPTLPAKDLGSAVSSPNGVWAEAPCSCGTIWCIFEPKRVALVTTL